MGYRWLKVPGSILSFGLFLSAAAKAYGYEWLPNFSTRSLVAVGVGSFFLWLVGGLWHLGVGQSRQLKVYESAWDRTNFFLIPICSALEIIIAALAKQDKSMLVESEQRQRASVRLRELGIENQLCIWGNLYFEDEGEMAEESRAIPPTFWNKNKVDILAVFGNSKCKVPQTIEDPFYATDLAYQQPYGNLRVSRNT